MDQENSSLVDDLIGTVPSHVERARDRFLPWHRVRKEFVRREQWNKLTINVLKRHWRRQLNQTLADWSLESEGDDDQLDPESVPLENPLRCLVIPGDDLLDIRAVWRDTEPYGCFIRYLGFNETGGSSVEGTRVYVANNAVTSLKRVMTNSRVLHDKFESIRSKNSQAYRYLLEYGPYHVVNLDFCGSMLPDSTGKHQPLYDALHRLLEYQFREQRSEWLLFITTEIEPSVADAVGLAELCKATRHNYDFHPDVAARLSEIFPKQLFESSSSSIELSVLSEEQTLSLFGIALGKWILQLCHAAQPQWTIALRRSYRYTINSEKGVVMLSLAFEFSPNVVPPVDLSGVSRIEVGIRKFATEEECAVRIASSMVAIGDVDEVLASNPPLKAELRESQADLLEDAGYDRAAYIRWVEDGEQI